MMRRAEEKVDEKGDVGKGKRREAGISVPFDSSPLFLEDNQRAERNRKMQNEGRGSTTGVLISSVWVNIAAVGRVGVIKLKRRIEERNRGMRVEEKEEWCDSS